MIPALFQVDPRDSVATALARPRRRRGRARRHPRATGATRPQGRAAAIAAGEPVLKFGFPIGRATARRSRPASMSTATISRPRWSGAGDYLYQPACPSARPPGRDSALRRLSPRRRPGRHAQRDLDPADGRLRRPHRPEDRRSAPRAAMPGASTASTPSPIRSAARSSATISPARAPSSPRSPAIPMPAAC